MDPVRQASPFPTVLDPATLDAFVDGALTPEEAARVVLHLADCPGDQAYVDAVMETNVLLAAAYAEPLHQAIPERLRATIYPDAPLAAGRPAMRAAAHPGPRSARAWTRRAGWAVLAASAALIVGVGFAPGEDPTGAPLVGFPSTDDALRAALETSPSGPIDTTEDGPEISLVASFRARDGRPCREFEVIDADAGALTQGVACRDSSGAWSAEIAVASRIADPPTPADGYVTASGAGEEALEAALDRIGAGMILTPVQEQALIESAWAD